MEGPGRQSIFSKEQWDWIAARYLEGYSYGELADFIGLCRQSVAQKLCRMGVKRGRATMQPLKARRAEFNTLGRDDY